MPAVIRTEGLGKYYALAHRAGPAYETLRDVLTARLRDAFHRKAKVGRKDGFWALHEVDIRINAGERVGIIGRNGAGKSTLLKLLSRITDPSAGCMRLRGRVASLLEVGTGFHQELSGRENILLNGSILGMHRADIIRRFDDIVEFAGIAPFLDTPVKRYSSGMQARLAFSVAAHLDPDVLLVDEVLAVGDAAFQRKCLQKLEDVAGAGRTVLFVSHNMNAIEQLCDRVIWIDAGRVMEDSAAVRQCIYRYLGGGEQATPPRWVRQDDRYDDSDLVPTQMYLQHIDGQAVAGFVPNDQSSQVVLEFDLKAVDPAFCVGFALYSTDGELLFYSYQTDGAIDDWPVLKPGANQLVATLPPHCLNVGEYRVAFIASLHFRKWYFQPGQDAPGFSFRIEGGLSRSPYWTTVRPGVLAPVLAWRRG